MSEPDEVIAGEDDTKRTLWRAFAVAWIVLGLAGALNHTIAQKLVGRRFDLVLPHLLYGHVMFNLNPRTATVLEYARADGVRRDLADLVATPSLGYKRARLALNVMIDRMYLSEVCYRASRRTSGSLTFFVDEYDVDVDTHHPARSQTIECTPRGLVPR